MGCHWMQINGPEKEEFQGSRVGTGSWLEMLDESPTHKPNGAPCHMGWHAMETISEAD